MQTLSAIEPGQATGKTLEIFDRVVKIMGRVPKMMQLLANSPAAAEAYLHFNLCLSQAALTPYVRTLIAAAVAEADDCEYSRVIARGQARSAGVPDEALAAAARGESTDPKIAAGLLFAVKLVEQRGKVSPLEVTKLRAKGYNDAEIVEIVATVVLGLFRNYFNLVAGTEPDGPPPAAT